eukprot:15325774-Ditylum_brightwellii.AAC.1
MGGLIWTPRKGRTMVGSDFNAYNKEKKDLHHHGSKGKRTMLNKPIEHLILTQYHIFYLDIPPSFEDLPS